MEGTSVVYAGIDTHKEAHVLCVLGALGRIVYEDGFAADGAGYRSLAHTIGDAGRCALVGIEGTALYGAGICSYLRERGYTVMEVLRPKRDKRRRGSSKNDAIDAERGSGARHLCPKVEGRVVRSRQGAAGLKRAMREDFDGSIQRRKVPGQHRAGAHKVEVRKDERFSDDEVARQEKVRNRQCRHGCATHFAPCSREDVDRLQATDRRARGAHIRPGARQRAGPAGDRRLRRSATPRATTPKGFAQKQHSPRFAAPCR